MNVIRNVLNSTISSTEPIMITVTVVARKVSWIYIWNPNFLVWRIWIFLTACLHDETERLAPEAETVNIFNSSKILVCSQY